MIYHSKSIFNLFTLFALVTSLLGSALIVTPAYAAGITVNTTDDELNSDSDCSLREAIQAANTDSIVDACTQGSGADIITVPAGTYTLTIVGTGDDTNATGDLDILSSMTINGAGAGATIIQAHATLGLGIDRVFHVFGTYTVSISGVTIANGKCTSCTGGGITNLGTLTLMNSTLSDNSATGGIYGGGLYNDGTLTVTNSTVSGNSGSYGAGIWNDGTMTVINSTIEDNVSDSNGGGIGNGDTLSVTNSTFSGNSATGSGGGIFNGQGTLTVKNSTLSNNTASFGNGSGLYNQATLHLLNTILANSPSGVDCYNFGGDTITTDVSNLIETNSPSGNMCGTPTVTSDPNLGVLADNGGPTKTFGLLPSSPALGAGDNTICDDVPPGPNNLDQRGVTRPQDGNCDIGAYESNAQPGPTLVVNTNEDSDDGFCDAYLAGVTDCTLREAINYANITAGTWTITFAADYTITLGSQLPAVTGTIIINGNGAANTIIQADAAANTANYRIFYVNAGDLSLNQLTARHGVCNGLCAPFGGIGGGIVVSSGTLAINNSLISANTSSDGAGALSNGISGNVTITNSNFSDNSADNAGGAITNQGSMTISNSTITNNTATGSNYAGGIRNIGTLNIYNSTISGNTSNGSSTEGANIVQEGGGSVLNLYNTIIANGINDGDCGIYGGTVSATNTLIESTGTFACNNLSNGSNGNIIGSDPNLGTLTGSPAYLPLNTGSPAINTGNNTICAAAPVSNKDQRGVTRPQGAQCDIGSFEVEFFTLTFKSVSSNDGWVLESTETSNVGGTMNTAATTFNLGDDVADKQYRALLHFDTSSLPDTAVITKVTLKIKKQGVVGTDPFTILSGLRVDMRKPSFGTVALAIGDFQAVAGRTSVATFGVTPVSNWYSAVLNGSGRNYVNKTGTTQFRLLFATDDNDDNGADYMRFFSGNAGAASRPQLIIEY